MAGYTPTALGEVIDGLVQGKERSLALMSQAVRSLEERLGEIALLDHASVEVAAALAASKDVFVVHGHDSDLKREAADVLRRAGLNPIILHEQPNGGKTIIEKFERHGGGAGFAVVLLTPDDVGGPSPDQLRPRARQNVIGEMFWFAGKLGRSRVCALRKGDVEVPSDFAGVVYTNVDDRGAWKTDLLKELGAAGYTDRKWGLALS
jgi:predicted nucleotide-binding protein